MMKDLIIKQVKTMLRKAILRFAKKIDMSPQVVGIMIKPYGAKGDFGLSVYCNMKFIEEVRIDDLYSLAEVFTYKAMGFDPKKGTEEWVSKFILKVAVDRNINMDVQKPMFYLFLKENEIYAVMYLDGNQVLFSQSRSDIPLEYILETK
ncbi:MAG: hypothetical protein HC892_01520 [Saprospiraceae bacterium]|nr:hypothetical protein [Saprospiraceae bacterium]